MNGNIYFFFRDRNVILNVLRNGGYTHIMKLLGALHGLMQSEAVSALTVTSAVVLIELENDSKHKEEMPSQANVPNEEKIAGGNLKNLKFSDFEMVLIEGDVGEKLKHLIIQHGVKMDEHILENIFTFLEIVTKFGELALSF